MDITLCFQNLYLSQTIFNSLNKKRESENDGLVLKLQSEVLKLFKRKNVKCSVSISGLGKKAQPHATKFWNNAKVEMLPPKMSDWPAIKKSFIGLKNAAVSGKFLDVTVKEACVNTLVAAEIAFWFYVGEIIGRRSLIGYNV